MGKPQNKKKKQFKGNQSVRKASKEQLRRRRARLIVRNLSFDVTDENIREHFGQYGVLEDVTLLKRDDGMLMGCAFVQFERVQKAAKARHHTNDKVFLGRQISVNFALAKDRYLETVGIKKEKDGDIDNRTTTIKQEEEVEIKQDVIDVNELDNNEVKEEHNDATVTQDPETESLDNYSAENETTSSNDGGESDDEDKNDFDDDKESKNSPFISNDITEQKTIFVKNVPFEATNEDLKKCMCQFGPVYYALICLDKFTEHPKGSAFVKFQQKEDAEKALSAGTELTLLGNVLDCHQALSRSDIQNKKEKRAPADSRNLYLVKEGVILAGTPAAEGVSASDMAKRLQLEQYKTNVLRNLNTFVSRERLIVHNLPATWVDRKLQILFKKYCHNDNAVIKEARIMRDVKNVNVDGLGSSREYGFVTFERHEDALAALRALNNNPNIFSAQKRPIVAFSIENKSILRVKEKRLEKSRTNNLKHNPNTTKKNKKLPGNNKAIIVANEPKEFAGVTATAGVTSQKIRNKFNLKKQAALHLQNIKREKHKQKHGKKSLCERQKEFTKLPKQKINNRRDNDAFSKIVSAYKKTLVKGKINSRWYD